MSVVSALTFYGEAYRAEYGDAIANSNTYDLFISGISVGMMLCVSVWLIYGIGHVVYRIGIWVYKGLK